MPKKQMYSFKIEKELIDKVKEVAKAEGIPASLFIRQALVDRLDKNSRLDEIEERLEKLEGKL